MKLKEKIFKIANNQNKALYLFKNFKAQNNINIASLQKYSRLYFSELLKSNEKNKLVVNNEINKDLDKIKENNVNNFKTIYHKHFNQHYQFTDINLYKELLQSTIEVDGICKIDDSLMILNDLIVFQYEHLFQNEQKFLVELIYYLSNKHLGTYKMYFLVEESLIKNITSLDSNVIVRLAYSFILNSNGSKYFYRRVSEEIMKRKLSSLSSDEFLLFYNTMSLARLENKMFWLIADKANKEKFNLDSELLLKPKE